MFQTTVRSESLKTEVEDVNNGSYQQQKEISAIVLIVGRNLSQIAHIQENELLESSRDHEDHHDDDDAHHEGESSAKRQNTSEHGTYTGVYGHNNLTSKRKLKTRDDPEDVYFEKRIVDVIRVQYDQCYRQENMEEIMVKRADGEYKSFTESYYKYLHKNDIEDIYLMCINGKKEKRYMNIDEILKFCNATLKRVFEKVKNINLDVKHGYADLTLSKDDA
ncbi:hypothetical protein Tco_0152594 [Tanacetum coccineum]